MTTVAPALVLGCYRLRAAVICCLVHNSSENKKKQNTREGIAASVRKEKELDLLSTSQEWKTKTGKLSGDS